MSNVEPRPDLADIPMKPAPSPRGIERDEDPRGDDPKNPPAEDLTLPTE